MLAESPNTIQQGGNFSINQICMDTHFEHNIVLNWMSDELWIKREEEQKYFKELSSNAETEMPNMYSKIKIRPFGWNTWFMFKREWQHASSVSYQLSHSVPAKRSTRFLKWLFYAHYIYFLSTYFPLHPWNLLFCFQQCTKFVLIKVTNDFIIATLGDPWVSILQDSFSVLNTLSLQPFNLAFNDTVLTISYLGFFLLSDNSYLFFLGFFLQNCLCITSHWRSVSQIFPSHTLCLRM